MGSPIPAGLAPCQLIAIEWVPSLSVLTSMLMSVVVVPSAAMTLLIHGTFYMGFIARMNMVSVGTVSNVSYPSMLQIPLGS